MANCVCIKYNGILLAPTPILSLTRSYQDVGGKHVGSTLSVKLDGKVVAGMVPRADQVANFISRYPCGSHYNVANVVGLAGTGIHELLKEERRMREVFVATTGELYSDDRNEQNLGISPTQAKTPDTQTNKFELSVNGDVLIEGYGRVTNYNSSSETYINTIDYSVEIDIEEHKSLFNNNDTRYLISSYTDTITMEPIEDSNAFNDNDLVISNYFGVAYGAQNTNYINNHSFNTRYNVSRTIEAVGKHSNNVQNYTAQSDRTFGVGFGSAFSNARYYVLDRLKHLPTEKFMANSYVTVNRSKVIESSESNGSFSIRETCLAIHSTFHPPWIDDWTAEVSMDGTFLQTVRINGTVKGLETYGIDIRNENASIMDGSQPGSWGSTQNGTSPGAQNLIHSYAYSLPDIITPQDQSTDTPAPSQSIAINDNAVIRNPAGGTIPTVVANPDLEKKIGKYQNAIRGMYWLKNSQAIYETPIFKRAQLFSWNTNNFNSPNINPYKWLNNTQYLNERMNGIPSALNANIPQLNPIPISMTESHRKNVGEIDYSFEFNNRPLNLIPGSVSETLNINDTFPSQQIAEVFVLGRKLGPVLQNLGTVTSSTRDITFEVVLPRPRLLSQRFIFPAAQYTAITGVVEQLNPKYTFGTTSAPASSIKSYVKNDTQSYDPLEGRIRIQKTWVWQRAK